MNDKPLETLLVTHAISLHNSHAALRGIPKWTATIWAREEQRVFTAYGDTPKQAAVGVVQAKLKNKEQDGG